MAIFQGLINNVILNVKYKWHFVFLLVLTLVAEYFLDLILFDGDGIVSVRVVFYASMFGYILLIGIILNLFLGAKIKLLVSRSKWVDSSLRGTVDGIYFISIFRITSAILCLLLAYRYIDYIPFIYYERGESFQDLIRYAHVAWIATLALVILGTKYRVIYILNFLGAYYLLQGNIGCEMLRIGAFWMIFIMPQGNLRLVSSRLKVLGLGNKIPEFTPKWAVFLLGINLSFLITTAGVYKILDPIWLESGLGFYYSFLQPWIKVSYSSILLDYEWFVYPMNYLGIVFETLAFFFFLIERTRKIGMFFMFCFLALVFFPLRIDPVGPAGLAILIALLSLFKFKSSLVRAPSVEMKVQPRFHRLGFLVVLVFVSHQIMGSLVSAPKLFKYPFVSYPFKLVSDEQTKNNLFQKALYPITKRVERSYKPIPKLFGAVPIFNYNQSFDRSIYQIYWVNNGERKKAWRVYNDDGTLDPSGLRTGFMKPLTLHVIYEELALIYHKVSLKGGLEALNERNKRLLNALFTYARTKVSKRDTELLAGHFELEIYPIIIPSEFEGQFENVRTDYRLILRYDKINEQISIVEMPVNIIDFKRVKNHFFKSGKIVFDPFNR